jgi:hypothetical protein
MKTFRIQYASNFFVHQNSCWKQAQKLLVPRKAPNLALLGNIGNTQSHKTKDFIRWCADTWDHVYCVPGPCELRENDHLFGVFNKVPKNVTILDHTAHQAASNLLILGAPLWSAHGKQMAQRKWSEAERYFLAFKPPKTIQNWHEDDKEYLQEQIRANNSCYGQSLKLLLLTHHVPHRNFLPSVPGETDRQIILHDADSYSLFGPNVVGCLSGAGGGSNTGFHGRYKAFCGVNAAFQGPTMVPNAYYRPDLTASFPLDTVPPAAEPSGYRGRVSLLDILSFPKVAVAHANPVLQ